MLRRVNWPNRQGCTFVNDRGGEVLDARHDGTVAAGTLQLQSLRPDSSMCGYEGVKFFSLDRSCELGLDLAPERLSGEALLALVNEHGEECN